MSLSHATPPAVHWFSRLATALDPRSAPRLARLLLGAVLACGRRTLTSWIRAAGLSGAFRPCYRTVAAAGQQTDWCAARLLCEVLQPLWGRCPRLVFALDDTPTPRYGPRVQGAGVHHNPAPGPAGSPFVYGHLWVVLALLLPHRRWGMHALPLLARLYTRQKDLPRIHRKDRPLFHTKLELAVELVQWARMWLQGLGKSLWVVVDGAYAKAAFLKTLRGLGVTVVSRLRRDAALWSVPGPRQQGQRGRPRLYGEHRLELAKRAAQHRGWRRLRVRLYGKRVCKRYQTFLATWRPAGGRIRVVLVAEERSGWVAFFCTEVTASVAEIVQTVAHRFSLETCFRDCKESVGAGQQQVRLRPASVGAFHVCLWTYTLTEAWAWTRPDQTLVGHRCASPWDDQPRRPSHADKRRAWRRELLREEIHTVLVTGPSTVEIETVTERLLSLAA